MANQKMGRNKSKKKKKKKKNTLKNKFKVVT
jgi:hypothetical protein